MTSACFRYDKIGREDAVVWPPCLPPLSRRVLICHRAKVIARPDRQITQNRRFDINGFLHRVSPYFFMPNAQANPRCAYTEPENPKKARRRSVGLSAKLEAFYHFPSANSLEAVWLKLVNI
uniref:Uncharacterized protein n=1 Tax=Candidatus Kentrum sp. TUN TaxID=2126343 RepID=A0A450ZJK1_9GAMM|nr:MAG: hypothetical protein BECKTUN1418F_GA0071002_10341 [Candidatus Kentron sp. TUN]